MSTTVNPFNDSKINVPTSGTTNNGTKIRKVSDNTMDKNAFLKILAAQLSHLDPSQDQDSTAYVSQMAQFTAMEQMQNLNTTMSNSAYQQMVGKTVITNNTDDDGNYVQGYVTEVIKKSGGTYLTLVIDGKKEEVSAENIIGTVKTDDSNTITNTNANSKTAINSDFLAASALAADKKSVVVADSDKDGKITFLKGKVTGAYIDAVNSAKVKIKVDVLDAEGTTTNKIYNYEDIIKTGDLTEEEMDTAINEAKEALAKLEAVEKAATDKAAAEKAAAEKAAADKAAAEEAAASTATGA